MTAASATARRSRRVDDGVTAAGTTTGRGVRGQVGLRRAMAEHDSIGGGRIHDLEEMNGGREAAEA
jgi:hypothetical protein